MKFQKFGARVSATTLSQLVRTLRENDVPVREVRIVFPNIDVITSTPLKLEVDVWHADVPDSMLWHQRKPKVQQRRARGNGVSTATASAKYSAPKVGRTLTRDIPAPLCSQPDADDYRCLVGDVYNMEMEMPRLDTDILQNSNATITMVAFSDMRTVRYAFLCALAEKYGASILNDVHFTVSPVSGCEMQLHVALGEIARAERSRAPLQLCRPHYTHPASNNHASASKKRSRVQDNNEVDSGDDGDSGSNNARSSARRRARSVQKRARVHRVPPPNDGDDVDDASDVDVDSDSDSGSGCDTFDDSNIRETPASVTGARDMAQASARYSGTNTRAHESSDSSPGFVRSVFGRILGTFHGTRA